MTRIERVLGVAERQLGAVEALVDMLDDEWPEETLPERRLRHDSVRLARQAAIRLRTVVSNLNRLAAGS